MLERAYVKHELLKFLQVSYIAEGFYHCFGLRALAASVFEVVCPFGRRLLGALLRPVELRAA